MTSRWCPPLALLALVAACTARAPRVAVPAEYPAEPATLRVGVRQDGRLRVRDVPVEAYVQATILSEFAPPAGDPAVVERMLEVQAVISRTYALAHLSRHASEGFDLCATTHCQLYEPGRLQTSRWATLAAQAVSGTRAQILWYAGGPVAALFHADCGGATSSAGDVWGGASSPYLLGRPDDGVPATTHTAWTFETTVNELRQALNVDTRTAVGSQFDGVTVLDRDAAGRARRVAIHGTRERMVTGEQLREVIGGRFGPRSIKSTWFTVRRSGNVIRFEGRGFGHGVGLCQAGALARVRAGASLVAVLDRYFPGTTLVSLHARRGLEPGTVPGP